jgi:hypothetical protein
MLTCAEYEEGIAKSAWLSPTMIRCIFQLVTMVQPLRESRFLAREGKSDVQVTA